MFCLLPLSLVILVLECHLFPLPSNVFRFICRHYNRVPFVCLFVVTWVYCLVPISSFINKYLSFSLLSNITCFLCCVALFGFLLWKIFCLIYNRMLLALSIFECHVFFVVIFFYWLPNVVRFYLFVDEWFFFLLIVSVLLLLLLSNVIFLKIEFHLFLLSFTCFPCCWLSHVPLVDSKLDRKS